MNLKAGGKYMNEKEKLDLKWAGYIEEYRKKYEDGLAAAGSAISDETMVKWVKEALTNPEDIITTGGAVLY